MAGFVTQFVAVGMSNYIVGSFLIPMTEEFGWTRAEFSLSRSIGQVVLACTGFVIGSAIDRYGGRRFIIVGAFILSAATYSLGNITTLGQWLLLNGLMLTAGAALIGNLVVNVTLGKWFVDVVGGWLLWREWESHFRASYYRYYRHGWWMNSVGELHGSCSVLRQDCLLCRWHLSCGAAQKITACTPMERQKKRCRRVTARQRRLISRIP